MRLWWSVRGIRGADVFELIKANCLLRNLLLDGVVIEKSVELWDDLHSEQLRDATAGKLFSGVSLSDPAQQEPDEPGVSHQVDREARLQASVVNVSA